MASPIDRTTFVVDAVLAAIFALVCGLYATIGGWQDVVVVAIFAAALAVRRVAPGAALAVAWAAALLQMLMLRDVQPADIAVFGVLYTTASYGTAPVKWAGLASTGVGAVLATAYLALLKPLFAGSTFLGDDLASRVGWTAFLFAASLAALVLAWTVGLLTRTLRDSREQRRRADADRREREHAEYRVIVAEERNRIARDMHDVVAHSLAVVIAQADGARFAANERPDQAVTALGTISGVARSALGDVRLLLSELRHREGAGPQPVLDDLDDLVTSVNEAGLQVRFDERGHRIPLGAGHEIAVYRIVQEGLTNALRHAPSQEVDLGLAWDEGGVTVTIRNAIPADTDHHPGERVGTAHGIPGMRERASLAGGSFDAGPHADGSFRVAARIPAARVPA